MNFTGSFCMCNYVAEVRNQAWRKCCPFNLQRGSEESNRQAEMAYLSLILEVDGEFSDSMTLNEIIRALKLGKKKKPVISNEDSKMNEKNTSGTFEFFSGNTETASGESSSSSSSSSSSDDDDDIEVAEALLCLSAEEQAPFVGSALLQDACVINGNPSESFKTEEAKKFMWS